MNVKSTDYHDYVIKNGKLIGKFEEMYKNSNTIPWHQDEQDHWADVKLTTIMLQNRIYDEIHDFGCGLGYYLDILKNKVGKESTICCGYDVSSTACQKAKSIFNEYLFYQLDLMSENLKNEQRLSGGYK